MDAKATELAACDEEHVNSLSRFESLSIEATGHIRRRRHRRPALAAAGVVAALAIGAFVAHNRTWLGQSQSNGSCAEGVSISGRFYTRDPRNDGALSPAQLGDSVGVVSDEWQCDDTGGGEPIPTSGIVGSGVAVGTELHAVRSEPISAAVAAVVGDQVQIYRAHPSLVDPFAFDADVIEIGVNSGYDGSTPFGSIIDPAVIDRLVAEARAADIDAEPSSIRPGSGYFVEFGRSDGLTTTLSYDPRANVLAGRSMSDSWRSAIAEALANSPDQPVVDGISLVGVNGQAAFHHLGGCRHDRPELDINTGETLAVNTGPGIRTSFFLASTQIPAEGADTIEPYSPPNGPTLTLEPFSGTLILEVHVQLADGREVGYCTTLHANEAG